MESQANLFPLETMADPSGQAQNDTLGFDLGGLFACLPGIVLGHVLSEIKKGPDTIPNPLFYFGSPTGA
jgi:hypothetical protein